MKNEFDPCTHKGFAELSGRATIFKFGVPMNDGELQRRLLASTTGFSALIHRIRQAGNTSNLTGGLNYHFGDPIVCGVKVFNLEWWQKKKIQAAIFYWLCKQVIKSSSQQDLQLLFFLTDQQKVAFEYFSSTYLTDVDDPFRLFINNMQADRPNNRPEVNAKPKAIASGEASGARCNLLRDYLSPTIQPSNKTPELKKSSNLNP